MDKALQRKKTKDRVERYRERQKALQGGGVTSESVTEHPVMKYLIDPVLRPKMESIVTELKKHNQLKNVYLGYPNLGGIPLDIVGEMLEVTR